MSADRRKGVAYQIPRNSLLLLMIAQVVVLLPFIHHVSSWLVVIGLVGSLWRFGIYQGRWDYPARWLKVLLVGAAFLTAWFDAAPPLGLAWAVALLMLTFALKLVEMKNRRDAHVVILLAYFVIAVRFLFDQSLSTALYQFFAVVVVTAALLGMNQRAARVRPLANLRVAGLLLLQALPLAVITFVFFPRIAPLWSVAETNVSVTGLSEAMTPGDVAELGRSDALAFRAVFGGDIPARRDRYWRALVYSRFEEGSWSVAADPGSRALDSSAPGSARFWDYEVVLEPNQARWLVALETPWSVADSAVSLTEDGRLLAREPVTMPYRYAARSYPDVPGDSTLDDLARARETTLPPDDNPRVRALAAALRATVPDDWAFVSLLLDQIRSEPFFYTLNPPPLPRTDSIDRFWFETRRGFCTHYAGALVFILRSVGIPARLVGGYQGGQVNPLTGHVVVRQYDAHAWVDVWIEARGWIRVDPTAAVAPARIETGPAAALGESDRAALGALAGLRMGRVPLVRGLLDWVESIDHRWSRWVVGYDGEAQSDLLERLLAAMSPSRIAQAVPAIGLLTAGVLALALMRRRRGAPRHPAERLFARFCVRAGRLGWARAGSEAPGSYLARICLAAGHAPAAGAVAVARLNALLYNPAASCSRRELRALRIELRRLQFRLAFVSGA